MEKKGPYLMSEGSKIVCARSLKLKSATEKSNVFNKTSGHLVVTGITFFCGKANPESTTKSTVWVGGEGARSF